MQMWFTNGVIFIVTFDYLILIKHLVSDKKKCMQMSNQCLKKGFGAHI